MPVNLGFQVCLNNYPWHTLVWDGCRCAEKSFLNCTHFSLTVANVFYPSSDFKVDWS